jgi:hypothetical protein
MRKEEAKSIDVSRLRQGISSGYAACAFQATVHCTTCGKRFCYTHAEDEAAYRRASRSRNHSGRVIE